MKLEERSVKKTEGILVDGSWYSVHIEFQSNRLTRSLFDIQLNVIFTPAKGKDVTSRQYSAEWLEKDSNCGDDPDRVKFRHKRFISPSPENEIWLVSEILNLTSANIDATVMPALSGFLIGFE